jgi:hypothetical protein
MRLLQKVSDEARSHWSVIQNGAFNFTIVQLR